MSRAAHKTVDQVIKGPRPPRRCWGDTNPGHPDPSCPSQCNSDGLPEDCMPPLEDQRLPGGVRSRDQSPPGPGDSGTPQLLAVIGQSIGKTDAHASPVGDRHHRAGRAGDQPETPRDLLKVRFAANQLLPSIQANAALAGQSGLLTACGRSAPPRRSRPPPGSPWGHMIQLVPPLLPRPRWKFLFYGFPPLRHPTLDCDAANFPPGGRQTRLWLQLWPAGVCVLRIGSSTCRR